MSAVVVLQQRESCHLLVDAARYLPTGVVAGFLEKCRAIPALHCAVTTLGPTIWQQIIFDAIQESFTSFDEVLTGIEPLMREVFDAHRDAVSWSWIATEVWIVGWSAQRQGPVCFAISLEDFDEWKERDGETPGAVEPFKIDLIGSRDLKLTFNPCPSAQQLFEARFPCPLTSTEDLLPEVDLLAIMEAQRRLTFRDQGWHFVGGFALLSSIDKQGVRQRRIHDWKEDKPGELIKPLPLDWLSWRAERDPRFVSANVIPIASAPLNRQQRRRQKAMQSA